MIGKVRLILSSYNYCFVNSKNRVENQRIKGRLGFETNMTYFGPSLERKNILHIQTVTFELAKIDKMHVLRL